MGAHNAPQVEVWGCGSRATACLTKINGYSAAPPISLDHKQFEPNMQFFADIRTKRNSAFVLALQNSN